MANALANTNANKNMALAKPMGIAGYLALPAIKENIANVVGEKNVTKFISSVVSAVQTTPDLKECTNASIMNAALLGEALNLTPSPQLGQYYMVKYKNKRKVINPETKKEEWIEVAEAQFQLGYKGMLQLAIRSGQYRKINASEIKEGEVSGFNPITEDFSLNPILDPAKRAKAKTVGYFAMFELVNGFRKELYWTKEAMEEHATKYSKGYKSDKKNGTEYTFWSKDFDGMAKKTMLRQLISKYGIMSVEMQRAYEADMGIIGDDGSVEYVDNVTDIRETVAEDIAINANSVDFEVESVSGEVIDAK